jgi:hypothetical protein
MGKNAARKYLRGAFSAHDFAQNTLAARECIAWEKEKGHGTDLPSEQFWPPLFVKIRSHASRLTLRAQNHKLTVFKRCQT